MTEPTTPFIPDQLPAEWQALLDRYRHPVAGFEVGVAPPTPGVYAFFRDGVPVFIGAASNLRGALQAHLNLNGDVSAPTFRTNVARALGAGADVGAADRYVGGCEVSWLRGSTADEMRLLAFAMLLSYRPALNLDD